MRLWNVVLGVTGLCGAGASPAKVCATDQSFLPGAGATKVDEIGIPTRVFRI